jgi:hypothetical protein
MASTLLALATALAIEAALRALRLRGRLAVAALAVAALATLASVNLPGADWRRRRGLQRYLRDTLNAAPDGAVILGSGDHLVASFDLALRHTGIADRGQLYVDYNLLRLPDYYWRIKASWPGLPIPHDRRTTRLLPLLVGAAGLDRPVCLVDALPVLDHLPTYPLGTLICLGRRPLKQIYQQNMALIRARGLPAERPDPHLEPWWWMMRQAYFRPLKVLLPALRSAGQARAADQLRALLREHGEG